MLEEIRRCELYLGAYTGPRQGTLAISLAFRSLEDDERSEITDTYEGIRTYRNKG
jgi:hypothetical protein